jgi:glycogen synthase
MRVLMFGWEFPPQISGGLGTACLGLTQSLVHKKVDLTFVVPKLFGNEPSERLNLISASEIRIPFAESLKPHPTRKRTVKTITVQTQTGPIRISTEKLTRKITWLEVESQLMPYQSTEVKEKTWNLQHWNYIVEGGTEYTTSTAKTSEIEEEISQEPSGYTYPFSGSYGPNLLEEVYQYAQVARILATKFRHDVIHVHDWMTVPAGIAVKKRSGRPLIFHIHATEFDRSGHCDGPIFEIEKNGMNSADKIVAVSTWTKNVLIKHYGIDKHKIAVVHNGIIADHDFKVSTPEHLGSHIVTFLGRITHQKGPGFFVEAARKVSAEFPEAHFIVAGSGDLLPQIIERVAQLRLSNRFHFTGFLTKEWIRKIWSISNVYVMPSVSEPFGITPLEAIQAGVPVIVSNQSGVAEVMPHALKVDFWDTDALAESICSVLKYKSLSSMLRKKGEKEIKNLSWAKAAVKVKNLYEEITL